METLHPAFKCDFFLEILRGEPQELEVKHMSMSEFDVLLMAVKQILEIQGEAHDRIQILQGELAQAESVLLKNAEGAAALEKLLRDSANRAGLITDEDEHQAGDLESLDSLVRERILIRESAALPDNVVELPRRAFVIQRRQFTASVPNEEALSLQQSVEQVLGGMTAIEAKVLRLIFGLDSKNSRTLTGRRMFTQSHVASKLGYSQQAISAIYRKAIRKLRHPTRSDYLRQFLEKIDADNITCREEMFVFTIFND